MVAIKAIKKKRVMKIPKLRKNVSIKKKPLKTKKYRLKDNERLA